MPHHPSFVLRTLFSGYGRKSLNDETDPAKAFEFGWSQGVPAVTPAFFEDARRLVAECAKMKSAVHGPSNGGLISRIIKR